MGNKADKISNAYFKNNESPKIYENELDGFHNIKVINQTISQLKKTKSKLARKKNIIDGIEFFLNDLTASLNNKNEFEEIIEKEKKKSSFDQFCKPRDFCNLRQKIKKIRSRPMLLIETTILLQLFLLIFFVATEYGPIQIGHVNTEQESVLKSNYLIQNLKGDTIDTWLSWRLVDGTVLYVNILNADRYPEKAELIKEVILSDEAIEIDDSLLHKGPKGSTSTYYLGWAGALQKAADNPTQFYIPNKLELIESSRGEGSITITLTNMRNGDGYSGFTKSIADESQNQILKSDITIYEVDNLSDNQFKTILRHELGHALGLAHSTAPEDLMYPTVQTEFPYISECDVDALVELYDGSQKSEVVCEK